MTDYKQLIAEIEREIEGPFSKCTSVDGAPAHTSQFGERYRMFRLRLGVSAYEQADGDVVWTLRGAVKGALEGWLAQGCGPVCVWRRRPEVSIVNHFDDQWIGVYFRCHFMSTEAYEEYKVRNGIQEPVENSA